MREAATPRTATFGELRRRLDHWIAMSRSASELAAAAWADGQAMMPQVAVTYGVGDGDKERARADGDRRVHSRAGCVHDG